MDSRYKIEYVDLQRRHRARVDKMMEDHDARMAKIREEYDEARLKIQKEYEERRKEITDEYGKQQRFLTRMMGFCLIGIAVSTLLMVAGVNESRKENAPIVLDEVQVILHEGDMGND